MGNATGEGNGKCLWELIMALPMGTANGKCHWEGPMGGAYGSYQRALPMGTANGNCQWEMPMGNANWKCNGECQWELPMGAANENFRWKMSINSVLQLVIRGQ